MYSAYHHCCPWCFVNDANLPKMETFSSSISQSPHCPVIDHSGYLASWPTLNWRPFIANLTGHQSRLSLRPTVQIRRAHRGLICKWHLHLFTLKSRIFAIQWKKCVKERMVLYDLFADLSIFISSPRPTMRMLSIDCSLGLTWQMALRMYVAAHT